MTEQNKRRSWKFLVWVVVFFGIVAIAFGVRHAQAQTEATAQESSAVAHVRYELADDESAQHDELSSDSVNRERLLQRFLNTETAAVDSSQLDAAIQSVIDQNSDIVFGVAIRDLGTATSYDYGTHDAMTAASVMKVLTAVYYLHQVELGHRSLQTVMANGHSAEYNMEQMIVVSDNYAWELLNENLGYGNMQSYAHGLGLTSYDYTDNTITSAHTAQLFGDLYERKLINESNTQLLLSYMERANYRDLIIPAVPPQDTVYHKAGEYLSSLNDAAIITDGDKTIVLSIYTESTASYSKSRVAGLMQQITALAIEAFQLQ